VQKQLLWLDHAVNYDQLSTSVIPDIANQKETPESIMEIVRRIEAVQLSPAAAGTSAALYGTGPTPANKGQVMSLVLRIVNDPDTNPLKWQDTLRDNREGLLAPLGQDVPGSRSKGVGWTEQDYNAALSILGSLLDYRIDPNSLRSPTDTGAGQ
jgi:hypothetical protein